MPPEITAGLTALTGSPPGLTPAAPPDVGKVSAASFASLLAQSSPPSLAPAAPASGNDPLPDFGPWKTMDTLPKLPLSAKNAKNSASELLLSPVPAPTAADAKIADAKIADASLTNVKVVSLKTAHDKTADDADGDAAASLPSAPADPLAAAVNAATLVPAQILPLPVAASPSSAPAAASLKVPSLPSAKSALLPAPQAQAALPHAASSAPHAASSAPHAASSAPQAAPLAAVSELTPLVPPPALPDTSPRPPRQAEAKPSVNLLAAKDSAPKELVQALSLPQEQAVTPRQAALLRLPSAENPIATAPISASASALAAPALALPASALILPASALTLPASGLLLVSARPAGAAKITLTSAASDADTETSAEASIVTGTVPGRLFGKAAGSDAKTMPAAPLLPPAKPQDTAHLAVPASSEPGRSLDAKKSAGTAAPDGLLGTLSAGSAAPATGAAALAIKPLTPADHAALVRQAADGVGSAAVLPEKPGAAQQISVQLHPKDWGSLQVSVTVTPGTEAAPAKTVTAHIVAETPQVKAVLQSQTGALHEALRESGLHLEHLTVSVKSAPETVQPASPGASAGFSSDGFTPSQGQAGGSSQPDSQPGQPAGGNSLGSAFGGAAFGAGSQNGRQGQPTPTVAPTPAEPEPEPIFVRLPVRPVTGRIDTRA